jgi:hypothetical protein
MNEIKQLLIISSILGVCGLGFFLYKSEEGEEPEEEAEPEELEESKPRVKKQAKTKHNRRQINGTRRKSPTYV